MVLFLNKITMGILTGHGQSHGQRKSVSSVFTRHNKLQLIRLLLHPMDDLEFLKGIQKNVFTDMRCSLFLL